MVILKLDWAANELMVFFSNISKFCLKNIKIVMKTQYLKMFITKKMREVWFADQSIDPILNFETFNLSFLIKKFASLIFQELCLPNLLQDLRVFCGPSLEVLLEQLLFAHVVVLACSIHIPSNSDSIGRFINHGLHFAVIILDLSRPFSFF